jgi:hypothetical protein
MTMSEVPARPTQSTPAVKRAAAIELASEISLWLGRSPGRGKPLRESDIDDLAEMGWRDNGYDFAKQLEYKWYIRPDAELVQILDDADLWSHERSAVENWVRTYAITLDLPDGTRATYHGKPGTIRGRDAEHAAYYFVPDEPAEAERFRNGGGYVVTREQITVLPENANA